MTNFSNVRNSFYYCYYYYHHHRRLLRHEAAYSEISAIMFLDVLSIAAV